MVFCDFHDFCDFRGVLVEDFGAPVALHGALTGCAGCFGGSWRVFCVPFLRWPAAGEFLVGVGLSIVLHAPLRRKFLEGEGLAIVLHTGV